MKLTHLDAEGRAVMVDVSAKPETTRTATARVLVRMQPETLALIQSGQAKKGDVLGVARLAGIMAAKRTADLIPLCHPLPIAAVTLDLEPEAGGIAIAATVRTTGAHRGGDGSVDSSERCGPHDLRHVQGRGSGHADRRPARHGTNPAGPRGIFTSHDRSPARMISVADARSRILAPLRPTPAEIVPLAAAWGRVLAHPVLARLTQPPADVSAMDGYAVAGASPGGTLRLIGHAPAGHPFQGMLSTGEAVRLFTGSVIPAGTDAVLIQENATAVDDGVVVNTEPPPGANIRRAGQDFAAGEVLLQAGTRLSARAIGLAAAANHPWLGVHRRPPHCDPRDRR